jgi:hypothetical protein
VKNELYLLDLKDLHNSEIRKSFTAAEDLNEVEQVETATATPGQKRSPAKKKAAKASL